MRLVIAVMLAAVWCQSAVGEARAHSFSVVLIIPMSGQSEDLGKQSLDGFMLATKERDAHPDNEADGHLGGLDVYVYTAGSQDGGLTKLRAILKERPIDIIVPAGATKELELTITALAGSDTIVLTPGRLPYAITSQSDAVQRPQKLIDFMTAFHNEYGYEPTGLSAQGYNEARRIDAAVRPLDSVDDKMELKKQFAQTETNFSW